MTLPRASIVLAASTMALLAMIAVLGVLAIAPTNQGAIEIQTGPSAQATAEIPPLYLALYEQAAEQYGLDWSILAAIGEVETDHGRSRLPGVLSGANSAGAEGPMQFEPTTFKSYALPIPANGASPASPYDPADAIYAAARDLTANGAANAKRLPAAIFAYNHAHWYVADVLATAQTYRQLTATPGTGGAAASVAVSWALKQLGTPYIWGGETPAVGFDCSGLVQGAYHAAGVVLPRVAQAQYDAGEHLPADAPPAAGDLVFFGASTTDIAHVGIVLTPGTMIDAPHPGTTVRLDRYPTTIGAAWGQERYVGSTRPMQPTVQEPRA